ncbi:MAG: hypothetical protein V1927_00890 [Candidatus Omnitrophota bacterium]
MGKQCKICRVPLEGMMYDLIVSKFFGVRPSAKNPQICNKCEGKPQAVKGKEIGKITHYYGHLNVGIIELGDALKVGDKIHVKGHTSDFTQDIKSMQIEHADVSEGKRGDMVGIKVSQKVHPHDKVYKV